MKNILDQGVRKSYIDEILSRENYDRKIASLKKFEVYKERQAKYVIEALEKEFSKQTVSEMRKITSINLVKRIINEESSIYKSEPVRTFGKKGGGDVSKQEQEQLTNLYEFSKANTKLLRSNKWFKLFDQCALQVIPKDGIIDARVLAPHHYDVIPNEIDPEKGDCYIVSSFDKSQELPGDGNNQQIADADDTKRTEMRLVWWTKEFNFITNGHGQIIDENGFQLAIVTPEMIKNELEELPFIDISYEKDFEYWVRSGCSTVEFAIDFGVVLSDTANINRLQGYSQAIIYSEKPPIGMVVGPQQILHIPIDGNKEAQAKFEFATPNPDMQASIELLEMFLRLFLTSKGIDPKTISGKADGQNFSSGLERLLAMIQKFEASKEDLIVFRDVEWKLFKLMVKWSNLFQGATKANGRTEPLREELRIAKIPDEVFLQTQFAKPEMVQTQVEKEDSNIKLVDAGLKSRSEAVADLRGIKKEEATKVIEEIDKEAMTVPANPDGDDKDGDDGSGAKT